MTAEWHRAGRLSDLGEDEPLRADIGGRAVGIYLVGRIVYAMDDKCPHANAYLTDGFSDGLVVTCPRHGAQFDIGSGRCVTGPGRTAAGLATLATHEVRLDGDEIFVKLSA